MREIEFILPTSWDPDCSEFLAAMGIRPKGLGAQLFESLYDSLFTHSTDATREYERYYSVEYPSLGAYIAAVHGEELEEDELNKKHIFLIGYVPQIIDRKWDDSKYAVVMECLDGLEKSHEN